MDTFRGSLSHRPLLGDEIRLLILPPGAFDDPICCKLKHVSLSACLAYIALSYVWGDPTQTSPMLLNGASYPITKNLESAIRHMRSRERSRILWVDAVSINQHDLDERSSQVLRMKDIYEQATQVIIWIGEWAPYTEDQVNSAFRLADRVFQQIVSGEYDKETREELPKSFKEICLLDDLLRRPWFTRTWVIQEAVVCITPEDYIAGPKHPIVICGHSSISFSKLAILATELDILPILRSRDLSKGNPFGIVWIFELRRLRHEIITGKTHLTPVEQLLLFLTKGAAGFEAFHAQDKIYAFLGLLPPDSLPLKLRPNYNHTANQVFLDYGTYILKETRYLEILACCSSSRPGLPSWVPDWKYGLPITDYHLGKASHLQFLDNSKIEVECLMLHRIVGVLEPIDIPVKIPPYLTVQFESEGSVHLDSISKESIVTTVQAIMKVAKYLLAIETKTFGCKALNAGLKASSLRSWISVIGLGSGARERPHSRNRFTDEQVYRTLMNIEQFDGNLDMMKELCGGCTMVKDKLRYVVYEDDQGNFGRPRFHGVLPKPGDVICYIKGATFQFILRPEEDEWRLIGTALGRLPLSQAKVALGDLKGLKDVKILEDHEKTRGPRKVEDLRIMEDYWEANKSNTTRIVLH